MEIVIFWKVFMFQPQENVKLSMKRQKESKPEYIHFFVSGVICIYLVSYVLKMLKLTWSIKIYSKIN